MPLVWTTPSTGEDLCSFALALLWDCRHGLAPPIFASFLVPAIHFLNLYHVVGQGWANDPVDARQSCQTQRPVCPCLPVFSTMPASWNSRPVKQLLWHVADLHSTHTFAAGHALIAALSLMAAAPVWIHYSLRLPSPIDCMIPICAGRWALGTTTSGSGACWCSASCSRTGPGPTRLWITLSCISRHCISDAEMLSLPNGCSTA